jgi:hypothetical protein
VAILGAHGLGFLLGRELHAGGVSVVFLDANPAHCRRAEEAGFSVIFGDALQERTLQRARFELVGTVAGVTPNQMLNNVFISRARERFRVPRAYVAVDRPESGLAPEIVKSEAAVVLFDGPHDAERWDVRERHRDVDVEHWRYGGDAGAGEGSGEDAEGAVIPGELFVILMLLRGGKALPMHEGMKLEAGDVASIAVHVPEAEAAHRALRRLGWSNANESGA